MVISRAALLNEPRFWYGVLASQFHDLAEIDDELLPAGFGLEDADAFAWWGRYTGDYDGVLDDSDGYVAEPPVLTLDFPHDVQIDIENHPGGTFYRIRHHDQVELLAETGPHWRLPGLRWTELLDLAAALEPVGGLLPEHCLIALWPIVIPESIDELHAISARITDALPKVGVERHQAARIVASWADLEPEVFAHWTDGPDGPGTTSEHSPRRWLEPARQRQTINALIRSATGT